MTTAQSESVHPDLLLWGKSDKELNTQGGHTEDNCKKHWPLTVVGPPYGSRAKTWALQSGCQDVNSVSVT